jgi:hypothetical protein
VKSGRKKVKKAETSTQFKIRLLKKGSKGMQEGFIDLWKHEGKLVPRNYQAPAKVKRSLAFNYLDEIPSKIRKMLKAEKIRIPR